MPFTSATLGPRVIMFYVDQKRKPTKRNEEEKKIQGEEQPAPSGLII